MMPDKPITGVESERSEEDIQREELGPRGVPGKESAAKMAAQREKKTPRDVDPGHPASTTKPSTGDLIGPRYIASTAWNGMKAL